MRYREHRPRPELARYVECFWRVSDEPAPGGAPIESVSPDGCVEWIFHLADPFRSFRPDGGADTQAVSFVVGEITGPMRIATTGRVETLGVRFRPGGAYPFFPMPLALLTDGAAASAEVWGPEGRRVEAAVRHAGNGREERRILEDFLLRRLAASQTNPQIDGAVRMLLSRRGNARVAELAREVAWSPRQLEREFLRHVGLSPKFLARILRFQNVLRCRGRRPEWPWADLAAHAGYADQAHMVREFREFAGRTPTGIDSDPGELTRHFVVPKRLETLLSPDGR